MEEVMVIDKIIMSFAGVVILVSLILSLAHSGYWLWLTALVGVNLIQAPFTGFCPMAKVLKALGVKPGAAFH